jgi:hypothetical protein
MYSGLQTRESGNIIFFDPGIAVSASNLNFLKEILSARIPEPSLFALNTSLSLAE